MSRTAIILLFASFLSISLAAPFPVAIRMGLTGDSCDSDADCNGDRTCRSALGGVCVPPLPQSCSSSEECEGGETCVLAETIIDGTICVSEEAALGVSDVDDMVPSEGSPGPDDIGPTPSPDSDEDDGTSPQASPEEEVCVDASALEHLERHELVFAKHVTARVLCDLSGSCATRGHMVVWKGDAMMMRSYCDVVGCQEKVIKVNSPKYRRGLRVRTKTEGLEFTAFAARYESTTEEGVLKAAVRVGL